jgi:hypothetical protein
MKVGVCEATELKKRSGELAIPFADLLWGYVIEDLMFRICDSRYGDRLWLETYPVIGEAAYREKERKTICFCYYEGEKPTHELTEELAERMMDEIFGSENFWQVHWRWLAASEEGEVIVRLMAVYYEMDVPVTLAIREISGANLNPGTRQDTLLALGDRQITYPVYAPENRLCQNAFDIMERLELISDMGAYYNVYRILRSESLRGRCVMEEISVLADASPRIKKEQRLAQIESYRNYAYMRKRWDKYLRNHGLEPVPWEEALDLILSFLRPIWRCLCHDEVFFDDWMPEIGRFI